MTCGEWDDRLDAWLQGRVTPDERDAFEAHLRGCASCRRAADDARLLQREARLIGTEGPSSDVWPAIAARLGPAIARAGTPAAEAAATRPTLGWRGLALVAVLAVVIGGSLFGLRRSLFEEPVPASASTSPAAAPAADAMDVPPPGALVAEIEQELDQAARHYERAIAGLEQVASESASPLDPTVTATLRENLRIIDAAIDDSREALRAEPTSQLAQESLFDAFRRKVALLQDTISLMNEMRKGNQAGAASIATGLSKG